MMKNQLVRLIEDTPDVIAALRGCSRSMESEVLESVSELYEMGNSIEKEKGYNVTEKERYRLTAAGHSREEIARRLAFTRQAKTKPGERSPQIHHMAPITPTFVDYADDEARMVYRLTRLAIERGFFNDDARKVLAHDYVRLGNKVMLSSAAGDDVPRGVWMLCVALAEFPTVMDDDVVAEMVDTWERLREKTEKVLDAPSWVTEEEALTLIAPHGRDVASPSTLKAYRKWHRDAGLVLTRGKRGGLEYRADYLMAHKERQSRRQLANMGA